MEARLSVIVPIYNVERYLRQCIESILNQTMREIEVILVDDGSTDSSGVICDEYAEKDQRIKVIHQENSGLMAARSVGVTESKCDYVTFVDGDDFIDPISYVLAEDAMNRNIDAVLFGIRRYKEKEVQIVKCCSLPAGVYNRSEIEQKIWPTMFWDCRKGFGMNSSLCPKIMKRNLLAAVYSKFTQKDIYFQEDIVTVYPLLLRVQSLEIKHCSYYYYRPRERFEVPPYISDEQFFDKFYRCYCYLKAEFEGNRTLLKQLEYYYMYSVNKRKLLYGDIKKNDRYLFPFDKVKKGDKVVLYGAGVVGETYMDQLGRIDYCEVVLWVDQNYRNYEEKGVAPVEQIKAVSYDRIVIAIHNKGAKKTVESNLIAMGVESSKIVK